MIDQKMKTNQTEGGRSEKKGDSVGVGLWKFQNDIVFKKI